MTTDDNERQKGLIVKKEVKNLLGNEKKTNFVSIKLKKYLYSNTMNVVRRIVDLYADGFRQLTIGRTLWMIIIIKLVIIFAVLKCFFFPDFIATHAEEGQESDFVAGQVLGK